MKYTQSIFCRAPYRSYLKYDPKQKVIVRPCQDYRDSNDKILIKVEGETEKLYMLVFCHLRKFQRPWLSLYFSVSYAYKITCANDVNGARRDLGIVKWIRKGYAS